MKRLKKIVSESLKESDGQMLVRISKKFIILFFLILVFDYLVDLFFTLLDFILGFIHLFIEIIEYSLELLLAHFLNSNHYQSDVIIVNFVILLSLYGLFRLSFKLPRLYIWIIRRIKAGHLKRKRKNDAYWSSLPLIRKIEIITTYLLGIFSILVFLTL